MRSGTLHIVACALTWGTIGAIVKHVETSPAVIVSFRLSFGALVVIGYLAARGRLGMLRARIRRWPLVALGVVLAVHWTLMFEAFDRLDVASAILIVFLGPVLVGAAAPRVLGEARSVVGIAALAAAFVGIALIASPRGELDAIGLAAAFGSAVLFAVLVLLGKMLTADHEPAVITAWQLAIASLVMAPVLFGADWTAVAADAPALILLGVLHTGVAGIVYFQAVRLLPAQHLSVLLYLEPASAVLYAWLLLGERPGSATLAGGALILAAGLAIIVGDRRTIPPVEVV